jgi:glycosylphosphatidylinositol transamidase (GPIT) subunit GPI8
LASGAHRSQIGDGDGPADVPRRRGLRAVVAALSAGWDNYRHQADALAVYRRLREAGVPDERIELVLEDDLAADPRNPDGSVRNAPGGPDLRAGAQVDHRMSELGADGLLELVAGAGSGDPGEDLLVYLVGHGSRSGLYYGAADATGRGGRIVGGAELGAAIDARRQGPGFRRMLVVVEACHAGALGGGVVAPGALLLAAADETENSFSANWDADAGLWRADQFSWELYRALEGAGQGSLIELYEALYASVPGSHVSAYNGPRFGNARLVPVTDFLVP